MQTVALCLRLGSDNCLSCTSYASEEVLPLSKQKPGSLAESLIGLGASETSDTVTARETERTVLFFLHV